MNNHISIFTEAILEGGGPMGYVFNMKEGFTKEEKKNIHFYNFYWSGKQPKNKLLKFALRCYLFIWRRINEYFVIKACKKSDVCFFQGYQTSKYIEVAKEYKHYCLYMPHSPYIAAEEIKRVYEMKGNRFPQDRYNEIYKHEETLFKLSDAVVFATRNAADAYYKEWGSVIESKKVSFLKSGVIVRKANQNIHLLNISKNQLKVGFIGRYVEHKGFMLFCDCANSFKDNENYVFITAGSGPLKEYGNDKHIMDLGFIKGIGNIIKDLDIIIIANTIAYYDLLPIECASYGKPLIMSYVGGNIDQLDDFPDSMSFVSGNLDSLRNALFSATEEIKKNPCWGSRNKIAYENTFTEKAMCKRWISLFSGIEELQRDKISD